MYCRLARLKFETKLYVMNSTSSIITNLLFKIAELNYEQINIASHSHVVESCLLNICMRGNWYGGLHILVSGMRASGLEDVGT